MTQQEELEALRVLVEKQKKELEEKEAIIRRQDSQIENMIQALLHARKKIFGPSTEAGRQIEGQLSLFDSVQELAKDLGLEQKKIAIKPHTRTIRQPRIREEMLAALPQEIEEYILPPDDKCNVCGGELKVIGKTLVRTEVEFIPAKVKVKHILQQAAKCSVCGTSSGKGTPCHFQKAAVPVPVLPHSIVTPSLVA